MTVTTYVSSNSGGDWWLTDKNWRDLESAGWDVEWVKDSEHYRQLGCKDRWLGALAKVATRSGIPFHEAIQEWESVTGQDAGDLGCNCCGAPHSFSSDEGDYYYPEAPQYGRDY